MSRTTALNIKPIGCADATLLAPGDHQSGAKAACK